MTIHITQPEIEAIIQQRLQSGAFRDAEEVILDALRASASTPAEEVRTASGITPEDERREAIKRLQEFGQKHRLSLGEPITRQLLHEGHRY